MERSPTCTAKLVSVAPRKQAVELFDLAALALPAHPPPLRLVPLAKAMEQEETVGASAAVLAVERFDAASRRLEDLGVAGQRLGGGVAKITEDGEVDIRIDVAERLNLEVREKVGHVIDVVENSRHDHHRARGRPAPGPARAAGAVAAGSAD